MKPSDHRPWQVITGILLAIDSFYPSDLTMPAIFAHLAVPRFWCCLAVEIFLVGFVAFATATAQELDVYAQQREQLVREKIEAAGVTDARVLRAMRETPRHEFVAKALRHQAYFDMALPIGDAQTISSPFIVAWMTQALDPKPTDKVLEIGTGSGYQAAVLSGLVSDVYTIEIVQPLGEKATEVLKDLGYQNVHVRIGDGFKGWEEHAPFDKIIVTCSPESVPKPLIDQLNEGGSMIIPVGERYQQTLYLMTKVNGVLEKKPLQPTLFVPMTGQAEQLRQRQPDPKNPFVVNGTFELMTPNATGAAVPAIDTVEGWYYGRQVSVQEGDAFEGKRFVRCQNQTSDLSSHLLQGIALDGREVTAVRLSGAVRTADVKAGKEPEALPALAVSLYDEQRRELGVFVIGPFRGTKPWKTHSRLVRVPPQTREAIVRIGLFGATGTADFDAIKVEATR